MLVGCSLFPGGESDKQIPAKDSEYFEAGFKAYKKKQYPEAIDFLRKVSTDSSLYPEALETIRKIPYQKALDFYEKKEYSQAIKEAEKIPPDASQYSESQKIIKVSKYKLALEKFENAPNFSSKLIESENLWNKAKGTEELFPIRNTLNKIGDLLKQAKTKKQVNNVVKLFSSILNEQNDREVLFAGLEKAFDAIKKFRNIPEAREDLFKLIGEIKIKLRK